MIADTCRYSGRRVAVLGLGRSGMAAARLLKKCGAIVSALDTGASPTLEQKALDLRGEGITVTTGPEAAEVTPDHDLVVLSPGIEEKSKLVVQARSEGAPLIGELELAYTLATSPVIAITGTNGKTTTTELTARILRGAGIDAEACGNIGTPMSELLLGKPPGLFVAEVSSFQLETIRTFRPKVALLLNLSPNHLDRYASMEEYQSAKLRIFENQTAEDWAVIPFGEDFPGIRSRTITFSTTDSRADITLSSAGLIRYRNQDLVDMRRTRLQGPHNAANLMAAFGAGLALSADPVAMASAVSDYTPPAHRFEKVREENGVTWINDSKATNLDAMEQAIRSVKGSLILIAGGKDKGTGFGPIAQLVRERAGAAILIGEMSSRIAGEWQPMKTHLAENLEEAVLLAASKALPGTTVLFSPGTSSYDMFRDYIERGDTFRRLVQSLPVESINTNTITRP
jgi:UDP-N-acetylmuramoylalanine--D-glutamate ligase